MEKMQCYIVFGLTLCYRGALFFSDNSCLFNILSVVLIYLTLYQTKKKKKMDSTKFKAFEDDK